MAFLRSATLSVWWAVLACSDASSTLDANGGSAGSAGNGPGGAAGTAGTAGASGGADAGASGASGEERDAGSAADDAGARAFQVALEGPRVHVVALRDVWLSSCAEQVQVGRQQGDEWVPLRDDRPRGSNQTLGTHYLDGELQANCRPSAGCDVSGVCTAIPAGGDLDELDVDLGYPLLARVFTQVGELDAPSCDALDAGVAPDAAGDAGVQRIPAIESSVPSAFDVRVRYHLGPGCTSPSRIDILPVE